MKQHDDAQSATAGTATLESSIPQVAPLRELTDYKVAGDDPDVRGWTVIANDGQKVGEVNDLLVDTAALRVRYLDVELDGDLLANATQRTTAVVGAYAAPGMAGIGPVLERGEGGEARHHHVLVPIGIARLDEEHDRVHLEGLDSHDVALLPPYDHRAVLNQDYEAGLRRRFDRGDTAAADRDAYAGNLYDEDRFYGPRRRRRRLP